MSDLETKSPDNVSDEQIKVKVQESDVKIKTVTIDTCEQVNNNCKCCPKDKCNCDFNSNCCAAEKCCVKQVIPPNIKKALELLTKDTLFIRKLEDSIKNIIEDDKIDQNDIPEIIYVITNAYNSFGNIKVNYQDLPVLIKLIYDHIIEKFDLIPVNKRNKFSKLVDSAIKLVMLQPVVANGIKSCLNKLSCCRK